MTREEMYERCIARTMNRHGPIEGGFDYRLHLGGSVSTITIRCRTLPLDELHRIHTELAKLGLHVVFG